MKIQNKKTTQLILIVYRNEKKIHKKQKQNKQHNIIKKTHTHKHTYKIHNLKLIKIIKLKISESDDEGGRRQARREKEGFIVVMKENVIFIDKRS